MLGFINIAVLRFACLGLALITMLLACSRQSDKPAFKPLLPIVERITIRSQWSKKIGAGLSKQYRLISPSLSDDLVYVNDHKGYVIALDRHTGKPRWQKNLDLEFAAGSSVVNNQLLLGSLDGDLIALDASTGLEQWRININAEILAPPQSNGKTVVVQTSDDRLLGFSSEDGQELWEYLSQGPSLTLRGTSTPTVFGPNTVTGFANGKLIALSTDDGRIYWERRIAYPSGRTDLDRVVDIDGRAILFEGNLYGSSYHGNLTAISPQGDILWSQSVSSYSSPVVAAGRVVVTSDQGHLLAFDALSGQKIWENDQLEGRKLTSPSNLSGFIVVGDFKGIIHVVDPETGMILSHHALSGSGIRSDMVADGDSLFVLANDGKVYLFSLFLLPPSNSMNFSRIR